jgi:hypothetical protein
MGDQSNSEPAIPAVPATESGKTEDQVDFTRENVMKLLQQATGLAGGNNRCSLAQDQEPAAPAVGLLKEEDWT